MKLTAQQHQAITQRGTTLLLSASAGSGKTEVLARRVAALIADPHDPCPVNRLLVVTFTRAAAAELRTRTARMLRAAAQDARDPPLAAHLRRQEALLDSADIGTLDAWCGRLVREHFAELGVDPAFAVLAPADAALLRARQRERLIDDIRRPQQSEQPDLFTAVQRWTARLPGVNDAWFAETADRLNRFREQLVNPGAWFAAQRQRYAPGSPAQDARAAAELAAALQTECEFQFHQAGLLTARGATATGLSAYGAQARDWAAALADAARLREIVSAIAAFKLDAGGDALLDTVKKRWLDGRLKRRWKPEHVERILTGAAPVAELVQTLLEVETRLDTSLAVEKAQRAAYEFGDIQRLALDLLGTPGSGQRRTPTPIALALRNRYRHVLIDEFQDTSAVQVELLRLVSREPPGAAGNAFMVGDVKQSIYGFRRAEPRLFAALRNRFSQDPTIGRVLYLSDNFRSAAPLVAGFNRLFAALLSQELGGTDFPADEHLAAARDELANPALDTAPRIRIDVLEQLDDGDAEEEAAKTDDAAKGLDDRIERETTLAVDHIRELLNLGPCVPERTADGRLQLRPAALSDCVVLLRAAAGNAPRVARVLRAAGLPALTAGREALLDEIVVQDVRNVLALLAMRRRDIELAAYLRSPLVGLNERELLALRAADPDGTWADAVFVAARARRDALGDRVRAALARLDRWLDASRCESLPELIRRILRESDLLLIAAGMPGGAQRVAALRAFERYVAEFAEAGQRGVAELVEQLDELQREDFEPQAPIAASEQAVRVMTIHQAKGLEFPFVFLLNCGARFNRRTLAADLLCDEQAGLSLRFRDYRGGTELQTACGPRVRAAVAERELGEGLRLLYVAATRARERLYICGHAPPGCWDALRTAHAPPAGAAPRDAQPALPLITRLAATSMLDWVLGGAAAAALDAPTDSGARLAQVTVRRTSDAPASPTRRPPEPVEPAPDRSAVDDWVQATVRCVSASGPGPSERQRQALPSVLSVSVLKSLAAADPEADVAAVLHPAEIALAPPRCIAPAAERGRVVDPRALGTATHRFLELADLAALASPAALADEIARLRDAGKLTAAEAECIPLDDVAWFGRQPLAGRLVAAANTARRELAFVCALPAGGDDHILTRGVIDCLFDCAAGYVILDYKTDRIDSEPTLAQRTELYQTQIGAYAAAIESLLARPVCEAHLVFLTARRVASLAPPWPALGGLVSRLFNPQPGSPAE